MLQIYFIGRVNNRTFKGTRLGIAERDGAETDHQQNSS